MHMYALHDVDESEAPGWPRLRPVKLAMSLLCNAYMQFCGSRATNAVLLVIT
jgi:hypothetical protein